MTIYALGERIPICADGSWVADSATLIGSVRLAAGASVWFGAVIRADTDLISIGERSNIQDNAVLHTDPGLPLILGREVVVGHQAMLHGCSVGDGSLIGIGAIVLNRARIGASCLVGAGALVPEGKTYPDRTLIIGSPARVARELTDAEVAVLRAGAETYFQRWQTYVKQLKALSPRPPSRGRG